MARLIEQGKVRHLGLLRSSAGDDSTRAQSASDRCGRRLNIFRCFTVNRGGRDARNDLRPWESASSPMRRSAEAFLQAPSRRLPISTEGVRRIPAFKSRTSLRNRELVARIEAIAAEKGCTPSQVTLAWLLAQGPDVVAIPGTRYAQRLDENVGALRCKADVFGRCGANFCGHPAWRRRRNALSCGRDEERLRLTSTLPPQRARRLRRPPSPAPQRGSVDPPLPRLRGRLGWGGGIGRQAVASPLKQVRCSTRGYRAASKLASARCSRHRLSHISRSPLLHL